MEASKEAASGPCVNSSKTAAMDEPKNAALSASVLCMKTSITFAAEELREAASIPYVNSSETVVAKEAPRDAALAALVPFVNSSFTAVLDESNEVAVAASVPYVHILVTASNEELREVLSMSRVDNSETTVVEEPKKAAPPASVPRDSTSATVPVEEDPEVDSADAVMKESISVEFETPLFLPADSFLATSSAASEQHNVIVCEVPKVETINVLGNSCDAKISAVKESHVTSNVTDLLLEDCKMSGDILCETIVKEKSVLDVDDVPKTCTGIDLNTAESLNVNEAISKKRHGRTPVPKARKSLCTCGADPSSGTLKKRPTPLHGCGRGAVPAVGRKEVRGRSMDRMHDSRYGEITVSVGAYERLLCYGDSLVQLGGADDMKNSAGMNISRKAQPKVTIESFGVTTWDLAGYDVPVQRNKEEVKPATATAVSVAASIDILDFNYNENSDGAFNTVKRRPRRAKQSQKELKSLSSSAKEQTQQAKVVPDIEGESSNAVKGVVSEKRHEKITDDLGGSSLNKTSRSPRHKSRKNPALQDVPCQESSVLNLPGSSKPIPNLVDDSSGLTQDSTNQILEPQRPSGFTQEGKDLVPLQHHQVDQDIPCGDQSAPLHRASAAAVVPVLPVEQFLTASSSVREPQHVDLLIGHTSGSGSMDLCYLRDNEANVEYTLVRRHVCCGNYIGPSEEGRYYKSSAEYMTLGVDDPSKWEGDESRDVDLAKSGSYSSHMVDPVKLELVEPSSGYDDLPLLRNGDVIENPLMQGAQNDLEDVNGSEEASSSLLANETECTKGNNPDFIGIAYLDGLKAHLKEMNSVEANASIGNDIPLISKKSCIGSSDLLSAKKLDDFSNFLENIGVVSVSVETEETPTPITDFRGVKEQKPEPAYLLELKAKLNIGDENESAPSIKEVAVANLIHLEAAENSVQESRTERSVQFNGAQIQNEFIEESQLLDYAPQLSDEDSVVETNEIESVYDMPNLMYEYFIKTKQVDNALDAFDDQSLGNVVIDQETFNESHEAIHAEEESAPFQITKPADDFSQLFKLEEISVKSSKCEEEKYLAYGESFDEAQYAELSTCHPGSVSSQSVQPRGSGSGSSDQLFPYNLVIDNPVYSSLGSTSTDSTGLFTGMCLANGVHDIELAETVSLSKEVVSDEYRNYLQDTDQPSMSSYGAGTMRRSTSSKPPSTARIQKDFRKKMDRFLTQNIRFHQQPKCNTALSLLNKKSRSGARGSSTGAAGSSFQARPSRHHDSGQPYRYPAAEAQRQEGGGSGIGGFPEQYSARLAEQLRLLMQEESRQLHMLQREQRTNLSEGALRDALLDRDIEQDVQREIEALERSLKIKEQQLLQLEEMQLRIQLEQMPSASRIEDSDQRQSFREIEKVIQQTVFLESSSSSPNIKKTRSEPYLATPSLSGSNNPSDDLGESPATLPRTQSPGRMHEYVNWTPEDIRSISTSKSKRRSQSFTRRTSSRSGASHSFSSEVLQQLENLRLELQRAEEAIQQRLDGVCIRSRRSTLDTSAESSDERQVEDSGKPPHQLKAEKNQRHHKVKHCCRNEKQRKQEEKHILQQEEQRHNDEKHRHQERKHRHHDEKHHHKDEKHLHRNEKHRHNDEHKRHPAGGEPNDEQMRCHHDEPQQIYVDEPQQHHLEDQRLHLFDEQQQRHCNEQQQRHFDEQQQLLFDEQQHHLFDEQQQRHFDEKQHRHFEEQQQEQYRLSDVQHAEQDCQEQTLEQEKLHEPTHTQRFKHQKQQHEPEQKLYENTRQRLPDGEQNKQHICGDESNEEKAHSNREIKKQQHYGYDKTRRSRQSKRRDRRNKDDYHQDDSGVPAPQSDELLLSHNEIQAYHPLAVMENWQDQVIAEQPFQFYHQMINDQHVISEQPLEQVMGDHGPEQQFAALPTEQKHEQLELLMLQEQQKKQLLVERYEQEEKVKEHHAQQPHLYENQKEHQYEEQRLCMDSLKEQPVASKYQKQQPIIQHQSTMSQGGLMKPGSSACAGLLRAGFEIGLSTLVSTDQECEQQRVESLTAAPSSSREGGGTNVATAEKLLHGSRTSYAEVQPQVLDDDTFHEKFLHEQQDELTRRALAERLTRSVEQLNGTGATSCRQDQLRDLELADELTVRPIGSETLPIKNGRRNDLLKTRNLHNDCQVHGLGRSYPDLEYAQAFRHTGQRREDVVSGNSARGVTISAEALLSKHTYVNSQGESSFDPKRDFEAAHQLLLDMESTDPVVSAPAPTKPKRVSYGDERSVESYSHSKEKLAHQLLPKVPALESRETDAAILGPHLHHSCIDNASDAKDDQLRNDMEDRSPATPSPPPPPAITRQYPANVLQELQLLTLQLQDTERMISRKLDLLVSPPQSRVGSAAPRPPKVHRNKNSHHRVSSLGSTGLTTFDYQNNNNSKNDHYNSAGDAEPPRRSYSVGCSDMITAAYCNKGRAEPSHKSPRVRVRPKSAPKARQPSSIKGHKATPKEELRSSQEDDGNDSSLCFAHIKKFWEKEKA